MSRLNSINVQDPIETNNTLILFNAQSVVNKWPATCLSLAQYKPTIIAITETWLSEQDAPMYRYFSYQQFFACRKGGRGGGVMMFFDNSHCVTQITIPSIIPGACELLLVQDVAATQSWLLVYRPLNCNVGDTRLLFDVINQIVSEYPNSIVLGDFNMHKIKWS